MSSGKSVQTAALVLLSFVIVAIMQSWPLPLHLATHLTGNPGGDTGVYIWNIWVFSHELIVERQWPFSTDMVLALTGPVDLSLHNYTVFSNLLAMPLLPWLGVVATFNIVYLLNVALAGLGMFLLVRHVGQAWAVRSSEAWLAALLFACSPFLTARSTAHFSLAAAAALPFFALCFDRAWQRSSARDATAAGACVAWAWYSDPYYAIYCVLIGGMLALGRVATVSLRPRTPKWRWITALDGPIVVLGAATAVVGIMSDGSVQVGPVAISMRTLYTPVLLLTILVLARLWWTFRPAVQWSVPPLRPIVTSGVIMSATAALLLAPILYGLAMRAFEGRMVTAPVLWRSSAPGVDAASLLIPNPNHPLTPDGLVGWVAAQPGQYEENVASIPWVALLVIAVAWRWAGHRPDRRWGAAAVFFTSLALGPFIRVAGIETHIPTPWTLLRYVPLIGEARMPARFSVLIVLAVAVLFAEALARLRTRAPSRARTLIAVVGVLLVFELLPVPRRLFSAELPAFLHTIAADPRPGHVLNVPFGIRDGLSSIGNFSAMALYFQTQHGKPIAGGYLSRVSQIRKDRNLSDPTTAALIAKSEGRTLTDDERAAARGAAAAFLERSQIRWVVMEHARTSTALHDFAIDVLQLTPKEDSGAYTLYEVGGATAP
jgi:hypothetical protein